MKIEDQIYTMLCYYEDILNIYETKLFYEGLTLEDANDIYSEYISIFNLNKFNNDERIINIQKHLLKLYKEIKDKTIWEPIKYFIKKNSSILHLVMTNNNHPVVKPYSEGSLMFLCQMHKEKHPSMGVTDARGVFYCFGCGVNGTVVNYLEEYERLTYNEVISLLARIYLIDIDKYYIDENDKLVIKYQNSLLSDEYKNLLLTIYNRAKKRGNTALMEIILEQMKMIERVRNGVHIKYMNHQNVPKELKYINPFYHD